MVKCIVGNHELPAGHEPLGECHQCHRQSCKEHLEEIHCGYCNDCWFKIPIEDQLNLIQTAKTQSVLSAYTQQRLNQMELEIQAKRNELINKLQKGDPNKDKKILKIVCPLFLVIIVGLIIAMVWFLQNF